MCLFWGGGAGGQCCTQAYNSCRCTVLTFKCEREFSIEFSDARSRLGQSKISCKQISFFNVLSTIRSPVLSLHAVRFQKPVRIWDSYARVYRCWRAFDCKNLTSSSLWTLLETCTKTQSKAWLRVKHGSGIWGGNTRPDPLRAPILKLDHPDPTCKPPT